MDSDDSGSTFGGQPPSVVASAVNGRDVGRLQVKLRSVLAIIPGLRTSIASNEDSSLEMEFDEDSNLEEESNEDSNLEEEFNENSNTYLAEHG